MTAAQRDTSVPNPPAHVDPQDFKGNASDDDTSDDDDNGGPANPGLATIDPQNSFSEEWIEMFEPTDGAKVVSGTQAKAENVSENEGPAVRLTSQTSGPDGNASVEVPVNVLRQLAGKSSTVALTLQSTSDTPTQITVEMRFRLARQLRPPSLRRHTPEDQMLCSRSVTIVRWRRLHRPSDHQQRCRRQGARHQHLRHPRPA